MVILLFLALPESPRFVATHGDRTQLVALLRRVDPGFAPLPEQPIMLAAVDSQKFRIGAVFADGRAAVTAILWAVFFATQFTMFALASWLPTILNTAGIALALAIQGSAAFNLGGVAGSIGFGALSDRLNPVLVLAAMYLLAMIATFALGGFTTASLWLFLACLLAGVGSIGAQLCLNAFTTMLYPAPIRATGLGWALSIGRLGAITGPLAAGALLLAGWTGQQLLQALSVVPLACAMGILPLRSRTTSARPELAEPAH
jgi:AAHS family 4-hydroxybenzoate transporter-like MFS transporter